MPTPKKLLTLPQITGVLLLAAINLSMARRAAAAPPLRVAYAGSMGAVMDQKIGPAFSRSYPAEYQGFGQASYALAHLLDSKQLQDDVFVSVTPGPMRILLKSGLVKRAIPVASTQMALTYCPTSRFAADFAAAQEGKKAWYKVLQTPGLRFGRTDPATDPQGRNIVFTLMLAANYYHEPELSRKILGPIRNESQIFAEPSLLARLESCQLDASIGYLSAIKSQHLPYIELPREINLADPAYDTLYVKASFATTAPDGKPITARPEPLVFYAATLANAAHPEAAARFVAFLREREAQQLFRDSGYDPGTGGDLQ